MKKFFQIKPIFASVLLFVAFVLPAAQAGTADGGGISTGLPTPKFRVAVSVQEGYNDNVFTANTGRTESSFTTFNLSGFADLSNARTVFTIGLGGGMTYYTNRPGDKTDKLANLTISLTHRVNERFTLTLTSYTTYQVQPQFDLLVQQNRVNGQYYYTTDVLAGSYQWTPRFSTVTSYGVTGIFYEDAAAKVGNDYIQQTFANQFRYLWRPTTTLVAEYRFGLVNYLYQNQRNTVTNYALLGFDHSFSRRASMTFRAGGQIQSQSTGGSSTSPYVEITGNYAYQRLSNLAVYLNYGFQYSNLAVSQTNKALRMGMVITHGFTPRLSAYLGLFYEHDDFSQAGTSIGTAFTEDTFNINTGLRFALTQKLGLTAGYQHTELLSNTPGQGYKQNIFTIGGNYSF